MNADQIQRFNHLAAIAIYHYCDVLYKEQAKKAAKALNLGHFDDQETGQKAYKEYEKLVTEYAEEHLPKEYTLQFDFWGAKCYSNHKGQHATKSGFYSGDSQGRIMFFDNFDALKQYTEQTLAEIE